MSPGWRFTHRLETPRAVYALEWSPDGQSFAFGGGFWYGHGFLGLASAEAEPIVPLWEQGDEWLIIANLAFARAGSRELIVAAVCGSEWSAARPRVFEQLPNELREIGKPVSQDDPHGAAIGIAVHDGRLFVHHRGTSLADSLAVYEPPLLGGRVGGVFERLELNRLPVEADESALARHDARIAVIGDRLWFAKQRQAIYSMSGTGRPLSPGSASRLVVKDNPHGIAGFDLRDLGAPPEWIDLSDEVHVNTQVRDPEGERLWLGLADHGVASFEPASRKLERVAELSRGSGDEPSAVRGVLALACAPDGTLIAAEHAGTIGFLRAGRWEASLQLPHELSPRSLAIDPSGTRLAIGCKGKHGPRWGGVWGAVLIAART